MRPPDAAVHDQALELLLAHLAANGAPAQLAELVAAHLEPILVQVSRDPAAQPVALLDLRGRVLTIHRFSTIAGAEAFAELNDEPGRWFAGVNLGQLLELAADQVRPVAHDHRQ